MNTRLFRETNIAVVWSKTESKEENNVADNHTQEQADSSNMQKNPDDWTTGDEPITGAQRSYLKTLSEEANEPFDENLTKVHYCIIIAGIQPQELLSCAG